MLDLYGFYTGECFDAYKWLGAHLEEGGARFRVYAPNAQSVSVIGDFNEWSETPMEKAWDGNFYECFIPNAAEGMRYKLRIFEKNGRFLDRADPYGFESEKRPQNASILRPLGKYRFRDGDWLRRQRDTKGKPMNIYEVHLGSWRDVPKNGASEPLYRGIAKPLIEYVKENGYNYIELMPLCEYPCDASWGYQAVGFYSPTSRYGRGEDLKYLIDQCHQNQIGVLLDIALAHFAVDDFGLSNFDGLPLYEYKSSDIAYNQWGSKSFDYSRGDVRSFLQSAALYWLGEFHFDGVRMDAVRNILYWQGEEERGVNQWGVEFLKKMNGGLKERFPHAILIAEDSSAYPGVTKPTAEGGLGFDYKWNLGWMNDTLSYFQEPPEARLADYHKLTFSMHYFYQENFLLPLSHDEVVHGKASILQKMNGQYEDKFPQARALYLYMAAHPGKKLNFMGNELGQLREWDEGREQDWKLLSYPIHDAFHEYHKALNSLLLSSPALYKLDYQREGFRWLDCREGDCVYAFLRSSERQTLLAIFNFSHTAKEEYQVKLDGFRSAELLLDSNWERFGGTTKETNAKMPLKKGALQLTLERFSGKLFCLRKKGETREAGEK